MCVKNKNKIDFGQKKKNNKDYTHLSGSEPFSIEDAIIALLDAQLLQKGIFGFVDKESATRAHVSLLTNNIKDGYGSVLFGRRRQVNG